MNVQCPKCGKWGIFYYFTDWLSGRKEFTCEYCNTKFRVEINFYEVESEEEELEGASSSSD